MTRKSKLLAAGVLAALALAALPAIASAVETEIHCPVAPCTGSISGTNAEHAIEFETDNGERFSISQIVGSISVNQSTTTTGTVELELKEVVEQISGFKFKCNSPGAAAGIIKTGAMVTHFINLTTGGTNPGVLLTLPAVGITYACASFVTKTLTGSIIGTLTTPNCNVASATNVVTFNKAAAPKGTQEHELWTGKTYDLISGPQASDGTTSALTARFNITWQAGNKPTITC